VWCAEHEPGPARPDPEPEADLGRAELEAVAGVDLEALASDVAAAPGMDTEVKTEVKVKVTTKPERKCPCGYTQTHPPAFARHQMKCAKAPKTEVPAMRYETALAATADEIVSIPCAQACAGPVTTAPPTEVCFEEDESSFHPPAPASRFEAIAADVGKLVTEKNRAYGDSFARCGEFLRLLFPAGIPVEKYTDALALVRIFDKQMRIATKKDAFGENAYRDIAGYGILGAANDERVVAAESSRAVDAAINILERRKHAAPAPTTTEPTV